MSEVETIPSQPLVFLGGTTAKNTWRETFLQNMQAKGFVAEFFFDPRVSSWDDAAREREDQMKATAFVNLFYLGDTRLGNDSYSYYSMLEAVMLMYDQPDRNTVLVFDWSQMQGRSAKSPKKCYEDLRTRFPDAPIFCTLEEAEDHIATLLRARLATTTS